jgi:DNA-binding MarR family transcriptional regulator
MKRHISALTTKQRDEMRALHQHGSSSRSSSGWSVRDLARHYQVSGKTVKRVLKGA